MCTRKKALLAAGLIAGAAALTGCSAAMAPVATPTPPVQKITAQPADAQPETAQQAENEETNGQQNQSESDTVASDGEGTPELLALRVQGETVSAGAFKENGLLMLPLAETAQAFGWEAESEETGEQPQLKRVITLKQEDSRITVSFTVSDNTIKGITWQKDGLLIPVNTKLTTLDDVVYVPSAFFEEAMNAVVAEDEDGVSVHANKPEDTPEMDVQETEGNR